MRRGQRSCAILCSVQWQFPADVSGQPIGHFFEGQGIQKESSTGCHETSVRDYRYKPVITQKKADLTYIETEV